MWGSCTSPTSAAMQNTQRTGHGEFHANTERLQAAAATAGKIKRDTSAHHGSLYLSAAVGATYLLVHPTSYICGDAQTTSLRPPPRVRTLDSNCLGLFITDGVITGGGGLYLWLWMWLWMWMCLYTCMRGVRFCVWVGVGLQKVCAMGTWR